MGISEKTLKELQPKPQKFWREASTFVDTKRTEWVPIKLDTQEYHAWRTYFASQGWKPFAIAELEKKHISTMMMPAQWPEWFDSNYSPPPPASQEMTEEQRWERYVRIERERYGTKTPDGRERRLRKRKDWEWGGWANGNIPPKFVPREKRTDGMDYVTLSAKYGRPIGPFEKGTKWAPFAGQTAKTPSNFSTLTPPSKAQEEK